MSEGARPRRILLVDAQRAFGQALWFVLDRAEGLDCVGHLGALDDLAEVVHARRPDVILLDLHLLAGDGRRLGELVDGTSTVLLADRLDAHAYSRAAEVAASGVVARDRDLRLLLHCLSGPLDAGFVIEAGHLAEIVGGAKAPVAALTRRELEVLGLLTEGLTAQAIAERLCIGLHTTRGHLKNVRSKLDAHSAVEAVARGRAAGLV
jgi:DNA-binding NarL/FixJ family response regulator